MFYIQELEAKLHKWVRSAGDDCTIAFSQKGLPFPITDTDSPWWKAFSTACNKQYVWADYFAAVIVIMFICSEMSLQREIFSAGSDCRFLRMVSSPTSCYLLITLKAIISL